MQIIYSLSRGNQLGLSLVHKNQWSLILKLDYSQSNQPELTQTGVPEEQTHEDIHSNEVNYY